MNHEELVQHLEEQGLRIAGYDVPGWYVRYINEEGQSDTVWVTDDI